MQHDACGCVTRLIYMWDITYSYVVHDSFICTTWLIHMCGMNHLYAWHDSIPVINCEVREYGVEFVTHMQNSWGIHLSSSWLIVTSSSWHIHALIACISASRPTWTSYVTHTMIYSFIYKVRDSFIYEVRDPHTPGSPHCRPRQHPLDWQIDDTLIRVWGLSLIHI